MTICEFLKTDIRKPCDHYLKGGMCSRPKLFRCVEFVARFVPRLSHSAIQKFMRCPLMYYYSNIIGLQVRSELHSDALRIGKRADELITGNDSSPECNPDSLWFVKSEAIFNAFIKLMTGFNVDNYTGQYEFLWQEDKHPSIKGFIDLHANDNTHFIELKVGKNPNYYTNLFWQRSQLGTYFLSNPSYQYGIMWAIRVPDLKSTGQYKGESLTQYKDRCVADMLKRPTWYFPGYNKDTNTFGIKFYRTEINLDAIKKRFQMIAWQIQKCAKEGFWYANETQCLFPFECDYKRVCETGVISESIYEYREKK